MALFEKKFCDICGGRIGLLGNRKLEDGNLCKDCQRKLSPWFSDRRHSTVEEIRRQLAWREANKARVEAFTPTRSFGSLYKVLLDDDKRQFIVTRYSDWRAVNPDVLDFSDLRGCEIRIDEDREELLTKDGEGKEISYMPPRYKFSFDFSVCLALETPYFDEMRFDTAVSVKEQDPTIGMIGRREHGEAYREAERDLNAIKAWADGVLGLGEKSEEASPLAAPAPAEAPASPEGKAFVFPYLPTTKEELLALPGVSFQDPFSIAAASVAAFCRFPEDPESCFALLDAVKGPQPLTNTDKSFIRDRFMDGKDYIPRSYFEGAVPENDYTAAVPYRIRVTESAHSRDQYEQGYLTLYLKSGGADSPRPVVLRHKPSTDEWFLWNHSGILAGIRIPQSADPWA